ncbi:hypothetical protein RUM43_010333 [Polyplax serrata]|uniref:Uncharacterized protein n=1 Tax=Polyplax serrata TaxID=468196 RepID=A0AAN8S767_POLSC
MDDKTRECAQMNFYDSENITMIEDEKQEALEVGETLGLLSTESGLHLERVSWYSSNKFLRGWGTFPDVSTLSIKFAFSDTLTGAHGHQHLTGSGAQGVDINLPGNLGARFIDDF